MRATFSRFFLVLATVSLALSAVPSVAAVAAVSRPVQDPVPIGPNQYFTGLVNGHPPGQAVIYVICPGPITHGHPTGKQPVEVRSAVPVSTTDVGYTGSAGRRITASLSSSPTVIPLATFTSYFVKQYIPTSITVPCSGTGTVTFVPSPGSPNARTATLTVTFQNLGA
jgi:hypothetical protein